MNYEKPKGNIYTHGGNAHGQMFKFHIEAVNKLL